MGRLLVSGIGESNPSSQLGKLMLSRLTNPACAKASAGKPA